MKGFTRPAYNKYGAKATVVDGIRFDSQKEARYYQQLKLRQQAGDIVMFLRQVPFHLPGGVIYRVDFMVFDSTGEVRFVDVKGHKTKQYIDKKRMAEALYPVTIEEV